MKFLFFKLTTHLKQTLEALDQLESACVPEESMDILNELFIIHKDLYRCLEQIEILNYKIKNKRG